MRILALDSATVACSVAVWDDGVIIAAEEAEMTRGHAEALLPMVERVVRAAGGDFSSFDRLAVTIGPGHFTGLRVGLAAARGLALACARPLVGITTTEAVAAGVAPDERSGAELVVALDSKRADIYLQRFDADLVSLGGPQAETPTDFAARMAPRYGVRAPTLAGDAAPAMAAAFRALGLQPELARAKGYPSAAVVARLAANRPLPTTPPAPLYIHPAEAKLPPSRASRKGP